MTQLIQNVPVASDNLARHPEKQLPGIPAVKGHWLFGNLRGLLPDPTPMLSRAQEAHGDVFTIGMLRNRRVVVMLGAQAQKHVLLDADDNFSSRWGWDIVFEYFGENVLVRDFANHKMHRRLLTHSFKPPALASYLDIMQTVCQRRVDQLVGSIDIYRHMKSTALDVALDVFAGFDSATQTEPLNKDLSTILDGVMASKNPLPGSRYRKTLAAKKRLRIALMDALPGKRGSKARDMFTRLASVQDDVALADEHVVDHMMGMLFAAHDTTASTLAMMLIQLAQDQAWQQRLREECETVLQRGISLESLSAMQQTEHYFKETLRVYAPIQILPRRGVRAFQFNGIDIPANAQILLAPRVTHMNADHFPDPQSFNPDRWANYVEEPFTFVPFGKGSHMCMGMHFALMEIRLILCQILASRTIEKTDPTPVALQFMPIVRPTQPVMLNFTVL